jgi:hypothetical protein
MTQRRTGMTATCGMAAALAALAGAPAPASATTFSNPGPITIPIQGAATPYPSEIAVSGLRGPTAGLVLTLNQFGHSHPRDADILLVNPAGKGSYVMSDVCGSLAVEDATYVFPKDGSPPFMDATCPSGTYRNTNVALGSPDFWPGAPAGPYGSLNHVTGGVDSNGIWKLFVLDDSDGDSGDIEGGWSLSFETAPVDVYVPGGGASGPGDPYPLPFDVTGKDGVIADVDVTLRGVGHRRPDDLDALLVGPGGRAVMLASDACEGSAASFVYWGFDDEATAPLGDGGAGCPTGTYRPTDHQPGERLPRPAPAGPYGTSLAALDGGDPNGEWKLYLSDDTAGEDGYLYDFDIAVTTRPAASVAFREGALQLTEGQTGALTLTRSATGRLGAGTVQVTSVPASASERDFAPVPTLARFAPGETETTVPLTALTDTRREGAESFQVTLGRTTGDARVTGARSVQAAILASSDRTPPAIGGLRVRGKRVRYFLSEPATVTLSLKRRGGNGRYAAAGKLRTAGDTGLNRVVLKERIGLRALRRGDYRLVVSAIDTNGNRSASRPRRFRIRG